MTKGTAAHHVVREMLAPDTCRAVLEIETCLDCPVPGGCREGDVASGRYDAWRRDRAIYQDWKAGMSFFELSTKYKLCISTLQRVVKRER